MGCWLRVDDGEEDRFILTSLICIFSVSGACDLYSFSLALFAILLDSGCPCLLPAESDMGVVFFKDQGFRGGGLMRWGLVLGRSGRQD